MKEGDIVQVIFPIMLSGKPLLVPAIVIRVLEDAFYVRCLKGKFPDGKNDHMALRYDAKHWNWQ